MVRVGCPFSLESANSGGCASPVLSVSNADSSVLRGGEKLLADLSKVTNSAELLL